MIFIILIMCDEINKNFWKCIQRHKYFNVSICDDIHKKELECLKNRTKNDFQKPAAYKNINSSSTIN